MDPSHFDPDFKLTLLTRHILVYMQKITEYSNLEDFWVI